MIPVERPWSGNAERRPNMNETRRRLLIAMAALAFAGPVACGKRGNPAPPKGKPAPHPRTYPAPAPRKVLKQ